MKITGQQENNIVKIPAVFEWNIFYLEDVEVDWLRSRYGEQLFYMSAATNLSLEETKSHEDRLKRPVTIWDVSIVSSKAQLSR